MNRIVVAVVLIVVALGAPAHAEDRVTAERYFRTGAKAYAAQRFDAAIASFEEAYRALPLPEIAFSAAQAYRRQYRLDGDPQHVRRAVELYRLYLAKVKRGGRVGDAADNLGELERELARLEARGQLRGEAAPSVERTRLGVHVALADRAATDTGTLREIGDVAGDLLEGVAIELDGKAIEPFALLEVTPGDHLVRVTAPGYFAVEKRQRAVAGATSLIDVELEPQPAKLTVRTEAGARIAIDGRGVPSSTLELAAGKHLVTVLRAGRQPFGKEIVVTRGQTLALDAPLAKTGRRRAVPWVLGGAGVLVLATAATATLAVVHDGRADALRGEFDHGNAPPATADAFDREVAARDDARAATWVLGGAALAATTVGVLLYAFDAPSSEAIRLAPVAGAGTAGVVAAGRF